MHRLIAQRLPGEPELISEALARLQRWSEAKTISDHYVSQWRTLLEGPRDALTALMVDPGPRGRELRQSTPFAGVLDPRTRWRLWREVRQTLESR